MGGWFAIGGDDCPAVSQNFHAAGAHVDHGLDGEDHAGLELRAGAFAAVIRDLRLLVELAADAVADKFADDAVAVGDDLILDGGAQIAEAAALGGEGDGEVQGRPR